MAENGAENGQNAQNSKKCKPYISQHSWLNVAPGDCFCSLPACSGLACVLSAMSEHPGLISSKFQKVDPKTRKIDLCLFKEFKELPISIDNYIPNDSDGNLKILISAKKRVLWPFLLEKAYAKLKGGYKNIRNLSKKAPQAQKSSMEARRVMDIFEAFLGSPCSALNPGDYSVPKSHYQLYSLILQARNSSSMIVARHNSAFSAKNGNKEANKGEGGESGAGEGGGPVDEASKSFLNGVWFNVLGAYQFGEADHYYLQLKTHFWLPSENRFKELSKILLDEKIMKKSLSEEEQRISDLLLTPKKTQEEDNSDKTPVFCGKQFYVKFEDFAKNFDSMVVCSHPSTSARQSIELDFSKNTKNATETVLVKNTVIEVFQSADYRFSFKAIALNSDLASKAPNQSQWPLRISLFKFEDKKYYQYIASSRTNKSSSKPSLSVEGSLKVGEYIIFTEIESENTQNDEKSKNPKFVLTYQSKEEAAIKEISQPILTPKKPRFDFLRSSTLSKNRYILVNSETAQGGQPHPWVRLYSWRSPDGYGYLRLVHVLSDDEEKLAVRVEIKAQAKNIQIHCPESSMQEVGALKTVKMRLELKGDRESDLVAYTARDDQYLFLPEISQVMVG